MDRKQISADLRAGVKARLSELNEPFDAKLYQKAWAKYQRMANQYSYLVAWTEECGIERAVDYTVGFYFECKKGVTATENRERRANARRQ